jgi:hypothetical protein
LAGIAGYWVDLPDARSTEIMFMSTPNQIRRRASELLLSMGCMQKSNTIEPLSSFSAPRIVSVKKTVVLQCSIWLLNGLATI